MHTCIFVQYEPIITEGNERFVYRIMLFRCNMTKPINDSRGFDCENDTSFKIKSCKNIVAQWAMGGEVSFTDKFLLFCQQEWPSVFHGLQRFTRTNEMRCRSLLAMALTLYLTCQFWALPLQQQIKI